MRRYGLLCGFAAALLLAAGIAGLSMFVPGYDQMRQTVSEIGEMDSPMRIPFAALLFGVAALLLVFAWAVNGIATETGRSRLVAAFIAFMIVPLVGIGIFAYPHPLHNVFGPSELVGYQAPLVLALTWRRDPSTKSVVDLSWIMGALVWLVLIANMTPMFRPEPLWHEMRPFYGIVQRALFATWFVWAAGVGLLLFRQMPSKTP
jgi:hypothetical membrane protein